MPISSYREVGVDSIRRYVPPLPREHGGVVMAGAALLVPGLFVIRAIPDGGKPFAYVTFVGLITMTALLREAMKRRHLETDASDRRRLTKIATLEGSTVIALAVLLGLIAGPIWIVGVLLIPVVGLELHLENREYPVPYGRELAGVSGISFVIPASAILLGIDSLWAVVGLWGLFLAFHFGSVFRVVMVLSTDSGTETRRLRFGVFGYHSAIIVIGIGVWIAELTGVVVPLLFLTGGIRAVNVVRRAQTRSGLKSHGRIEGMLSILFVLSTPWFTG